MLKSERVQTPSTLICTAGMQLRPSSVTLAYVGADEPSFSTYCIVFKWQQSKDEINGEHKTSSIFQMHLLNPGEGLKSKHADATVHVHPLFFSVEKVHIREPGTLWDLNLAPFFFYEAWPSTLFTFLMRKCGTLKYYTVKTRSISIFKV